MFYLKAFFFPSDEYFDIDQKDIHDERGNLIYIYSKARFGCYKAVRTHHYRLDTFPFTNYTKYDNGTWRHSWL